jgi:hypothetical protein
MKSHLSMPERDCLARLIPVEHPERTAKVMTGLVGSVPEFLAARIHVPMVWV